MSRPPGGFKKPASPTGGLPMTPRAGLGVPRGSSQAQRVAAYNTPRGGRVPGQTPREGVRSFPEHVASGPIPDDPTEIDREASCSVCQAVNPPHAQVCMACGASFEGTDQGAVRFAPVTPRSVASPPTLGAYDTGYSPRYPTPYDPHAPMQGVPAGQWMPHSPPQRPQEPQQTMWQRFLTWTGLRGPR
jgi:hypothetical protein